MLTTKVIPWKLKTDRRRLRRLRGDQHQEIPGIKLRKFGSLDVGLNLVVIFPIIESARKSDNRKIYRQAIKWAKNEGIRHVVFYKNDREARNLKDNEENEDQVKDGNLVLHYALEKRVLHKDSPDSDFLMRDFFAVQNKHYSRDLSTKVRTATRTKAESGGYPGTHTPLGYVHQKRKNYLGCDLRRGTEVIPDPNTRRVDWARREFELRAMTPTPSLAEIRRLIIDEGLLTPEEARNYHAGTIERRLKNIFYDGRFVWQGIEYRGNHQRIISPELFWRAQETFGLKNPYRKNSNSVFGGGWLKCGDASCGCNIIYDPKKKRILATGDVKEFRYYHCTNGKKVHPTMKGMSVTEEKIWEQFSPAVNSITITEDFAAQLKEAMNETKRQARDKQQREVDSYSAALKELEVHEDRLYSDRVSGILDELGYRRQISRVREDRARYTGLLRKAQSAVMDAAFENVDTILELATNAESLWKLRTPVERKVFLDRLLSNPVLVGPTVRYEMRRAFVVLSEMKALPH